MKRVTTSLVLFILGVATVPAVVYFYVSFGHPPVAVADPMFPGEEAMARSALHLRVQRERAAIDPAPFDEATLKQGASVYMSECSFCHGVPSGESQIGLHTFPKTPQLFKPRPLSSNPTDATVRAASLHWFVDNGVRLTAMPSYKGILSDNDTWAVANLLAVRDKPLPESVKKVLAGASM